MVRLGFIISLIVFLFEAASDASDASDATSAKLTRSPPPIFVSCIGWVWVPASMQITHMLGRVVKPALAVIGDRSKKNIVALLFPIRLVNSVQTDADVCNIGIQVTLQLAETTPQLLTKFSGGCRPRSSIGY